MLTPTGRVVYTVLFIAAVVFFLRNLYRLFAIMCLGRWESRFDHLWARIRAVLVQAFGQRRVVRELSGINHFFIFWGFMALLMVNTEFLLAGLFPAFSFAFLGAWPYGILLAVADIASVLVLIAVAVAVLRRLFFRPPHIELTFDALVILAMIGTLMTAYFGLNACEIRLGEREAAAWMPISTALSHRFAAWSPQRLLLVGRVCWWVHALVLLVFLNYLPYGKHLHIITAIPNCFFRSLSFVATVPRVAFRRGLRFGVERVVQFTWKDLLDFMSCTECGRCQAACPATQTGKVLNPKEIIRAGKGNLMANGRAVLASRPPDTLASAGEDAPTPTPLIDGGKTGVPTDAIWACTTCGACMEECPVFIEHVPKLIAMRRHLVMENADFPEELLNLFEHSEQRFNPWGIAPADRAKWARELDIKVLADHPDVEYLFFPGCAGALDSRNRRTTVALAEILNEAGVSWAILGPEEKCCGDSLRRLGNEYVFEQLARENVEMFNRYGVRRVITSCPHCYSTFRNDYRQFGANFEVLHHTQLISDLLKQGRIRLRAGAAGPTVVHDSCYLGRYNNVYDPPRHIIREVQGGRPPLEMPRHGRKSFCCGAGGGRMWMEEFEGKRICSERTGEALALDPSTVAVACPYCMTMFEDGIKDEHLEEKVDVRDVAELVAESMVRSS